MPQEFVKVTNDPRLGQHATSYKGFRGVVETIHRRSSDGAELISIKNTTGGAHCGLRPEQVTIHAVQA